MSTIIYITIYCDYFLGAIGLLINVDLMSIQKALYYVVLSGHVTLNLKCIHGSYPLKISTSEYLKSCVQLGQRVAKRPILEMTPV